MMYFTYGLQWHCKGSDTPGLEFSKFQQKGEVQIFPMKREGLVNRWEQVVLKKVGFAYFHTK